MATSALNTLMVSIVVARGNVTDALFPKDHDGALYASRWDRGSGCGHEWKLQDAVPWHSGYPNEFLNRSNAVECAAAASFSYLLHILVPSLPIAEAFPLRRHFPGRFSDLLSWFSSFKANLSSRIIFRSIRV